MFIFLTFFCSMVYSQEWIITDKVTIMENKDFPDVLMEMATIELGSNTKTSFNNFYGLGWMHIGENAKVEVRGDSNSPNLFSIKMRNNACIRFTKEVDFSRISIESVGKNYKIILPKEVYKTIRARNINIIYSDTITCD